MKRPFLQRIRRGLRNIFLVWLLWAFFWIFILWQGRQPILIIPKPANDLAFLIMGVISGGVSLVWQLWHWQKRRIKLSKIKKIEDLQAISPEAFEALVAQIFDSHGHQVVLVGGNADHGVDIVVTNGQNEKWIVQCKRYRGSVGEPIVRDLFGTMLHEEAQGAYLITTGTFTQKAQNWAEGKPIHLYDGEKLLSLIKKP